MIRALLNRYREHQARARLEQLRQQTLAGYAHQRAEAGRKAALKGKPPRLKRIPYAWKAKSRERANG